MYQKKNMKLPIEIITEIILYLDKNDIIKYKNIISSLNDDIIWLQLLKRDYNVIMNHKELKDKDLKTKYEFLCRSIILIFITGHYSEYEDINFSHEINNMIYTKSNNILNNLLKIGLEMINTVFNYLKNDKREEYQKKFNESYILRVKEYLKGESYKYPQPTIEGFSTVQDNWDLAEDVLIIKTREHMNSEISFSIKFIEEDILVEI